MKYRFICLLGLLALLCVPTAVSAEGYLLGLPSFGGWSCVPGHKGDFSLAGKLGYLGYNRPLTLDMKPADQLLAGVLAGVRLEVPVEGVWAGMWVTGTGRQRGFVACDPEDGFCLTLGGTWLFPNNKLASEELTLGPTALLSYSRTWRPLIQWFTLEAAVSRCPWSNFSLIGGFRFDSFSAALSDSSGLPIVAVTDAGALQLTSFLPYVGAETKLGAIKVGVIGFPWIWGTIIAGEGSWTGLGGAAGYATGTYRNGYFTEAYAEFGRRVGVAHLSAFATYTILHATGNCDVQVPIAAVPSLQYSFGMDRQNWIVGGRAVIGFDSPL